MTIWRFSPRAHLAGMALTEGYTHSAARSILQVACWRCVCAFCMLMCVGVLPELGDAAKPRCGAELIADLEFVCGDRGFYRGRVGAERYGGARSRGKGIVEQCCIKGCDLQHLEKYCAKPKRERRQAPTAPQTTVDRIRRGLLKQYHKLEHDLQKISLRLKERMLHQKKLRNTSSHHSDLALHQSVHSELQHAERVTHLRTFTPRRQRR